MQQRRGAAQHGSQQAGSQPHEGSATQQLGSGAQQLGSSQPQVGSQQAGSQQPPQWRRLNRPFRPSSRQQRRGAQHGSQHAGSQPHEGSATQQLGSQPQEGSASQHAVAPHPPPQPPSRPKPKALALLAPFEAKTKPRQRVAAARRRFMVRLLARKGGRVSTHSRRLELPSGSVGLGLTRSFPGSDLAGRERLVGVQSSISTTRPLPFR